MSIWIILLLLFLSGLLILLFPRVYFKADFTELKRSISISSVWGKIDYSFSESRIFARLLFFKLLPKKNASKSSPKPKTAYLTSTKSKTLQKSQPTEPSRSIKFGKEKSPKDKETQTKNQKERKKYSSSNSEKKKSSKGIKSSRSKYLKLIWNEKKLIITVFRKLVSGGLRLIKTFRIDYLVVKTEYGTDDPMFTGILFGVMHPLLLLNRGRTSLQITPDFDQPKFSFNFSGSFSTRPIHMVSVGIIVLFTLPWFLAVKTGWRLWRQQKQDRR